MIRPLYLVFAALLPSLPALTQQSQSPVPCAATEQKVLEVEHKLWSAARRRDVATLDKLTDDSFLSTDDGGLSTGEKEFLAHFRQPESNIHNQTDEQPTDVRLVFTNGVAILNFMKHWIDHNRKAGISFGATSVMTRVFTCQNGQWKLVGFHETNLTNKSRQPSAGTGDHIGDHVGHYRFGENGDKGEISVVRTGDKLFETWRGEGPVEILSGKYDTFFTQGGGWWTVRS
jgi:hypothetical protein